jgi:hypothetical protein
VDKLADLGDGHEEGKDMHVAQIHGSAGVPKPWQNNNEQALTPIDSNTMFSPDSYLRDSAQHSSRSQPEDLSSDELYSHVGHDPSPYRENSHSHLHSHTRNLRASPASSAPKLSYREHERVRDIAPQLPPLEFSQHNSERDAYPLAMPYTSNKPSGQDFSASTAPTNPRERQTPSFLHTQSVQAELPAETSPTDESNTADRHGGVMHPAASSTSGLLHPGTQTTTQRLSTDFTWRPGTRPGGYI